MMTTVIAVEQYVERAVVFSQAGYSNHLQIVRTANVDVTIDGVARRAHTVAHRGDEPGRLVCEGLVPGGFEPDELLRRRA